MRIACHACFQWEWSDGRGLRLCRVVDSDSIVLCTTGGMVELEIRLGGIAIPTAANCR